MTKTLADVKSERTTYTYVALMYASQNALASAKEKIDGQVFHCMTVILFCAFCLEAYLNHIGPIYVPYWDSIERLRPLDKLKIISHHIDYKLDLGRAPFQSFIEIKKYRDLLVHGRTIRTESEREELIDVGKEIPDLLPSKWEKMSTLENAEKYQADTIKMVEELHKAAGFTEDPFYSMLHAKWEVTPKKENQ